MARQKAGARPTNVYVGPIPGHPVRICARPVRGPTPRDPRWYWRAVVYEEGGARDVWTGRGTPAEVTIQLDEILRRGGYRAEEEPSGDLVVINTVGELLSYWVGLQKERKDIRPATAEVYERHARAVYAGLGNVRVDQLDRRALERFRDARLGDGKASGTVATHLRVLRIAWRWAHDAGVVDNPRLPRVQLTHAPVRSTYTPSASDVARVLAVLEARENEPGRTRGWARWAMRLQWSTGMRVSEVADLAVADLDLDGAKIYLRKTKTKRPRAVHLRPEFAEQLRQYVATRQGDGRLWPVGTQPFRVALNEVLVETCALAGVPHWSSHGFRRAAVTRWIRAGAGLKEGADQFGHSLEVMIRIYQHIAESDTKDAAHKAALDQLPELPAVEE